MVTTHENAETETYNLKREKTEEKGIEYQTRTTDRNTKEKNQGRHRATKKQEIKWLQESLIHQ